MVEKMPDAHQEILLADETASISADSYAGDQPNPRLRAFVEAHLAAHPYDPETDIYDIPAFTTPIETTKATAIYNMHTYWSKKPHDAIRQYIRHYTQPGDLVLDPFCGSGSTALAALMEGRAAIASDRSPAATFITKNYCTPVDTVALKLTFEELKKKVQPELNWLYATRCERCGGPATTAYTVYSQVFECHRCLKRVPLFDCPAVKIMDSQGKEKVINVCPACLEIGVEAEISTRGKKFGAVPVLVSYLCLGKCKPKRDERRHNDEDPKKREYFEKFDLAKIQDIEAKEIPHWYPRHKMMNVEDDTRPWGAEWREGRNFRSVAELFTRRNLWALAAILDACKASPMAEALRFVFQSNVLSGTRMQRYREGGGGFASGTYYLPQLSLEREQTGCFERKFEDIIAAQTEIKGGLKSQNLYISTQSSTNLANIPSNSVDYIFTDPPYADKVQYGELNFVWEAWLGFDTNWHQDEIIVNAVRGKSKDEWAALMKVAFAECYRVLKPGRWLSLCYHDTAEGTWTQVQNLMAEVGFVPDLSDSVLYIDAGQKSYNQLTADKITKRDLVINFRKPRLGELSDVIIYGDEDEQTFKEKVHQIMDMYLAAHPGTTKDRVYDEVVSHMVRAGDMEAHDFDGLLGEIAEQAADDPTRWFLRHEEEEKLAATDAAREEEAARIIGEVLQRAQEDDPEVAVKGLHYSQLFEQYLYRVKEKPRRSIGDWLPDYFYVTDAGAYRLPANEEEREFKLRARQAGVNRHIKRFLSFLLQGLAVPERERPDPATLAEWINQSRVSRQYEQGKLLYERGGLDLTQLSEEQLMQVEEHYQICAMRAEKEKQKHEQTAAQQAKTRRVRRRADREHESTERPTLFDL